MAKQKFTHFVPRDKPKKRPGVHTKSQNKNAKRQKKQTRYKGQGRWLKNLLNGCLRHDANVEQKKNEMD